MAGLVMGYGVVLASLSLIIRSLVPGFAKIPSITGIAGGGLCVLWGILALAGHKRRAWAVLSMIAVSFVFLNQFVHAWMVSADERSGILAGRLLLTLIMLLTVGMLMYLLHGERPPEFYLTGTARRNDPPPQPDGASPESGRRRR